MVVVFHNNVRWIFINLANYEKASLKFKSQKLNVIILKYQGEMKKLKNVYYSTYFIDDSVYFAERYLTFVMERA